MAFYKKIHLQYNGAKYLGWQIQKDENTVQGNLNRVLIKLYNTELIKTVGSGRTDRGVHAQMQIVRLEAPKNFPNIGLLKGLNSLLPHDIRAVSVEDCTEDFHPIRDAISKEYRYYFKFQKDPFYSDLISYCPYELDEILLRKCLNHFVGIHDFKNFYCTGTDVSSTIREIYQAELEDVTKEFGFSSGETVLCITFIGNGFLKQMVRQMVGALWNVARGAITEQEFLDSLSSSSNFRAGDTAPPNGLFLFHVTY